MAGGEQDRGGVHSQGGTGGGGHHSQDGASGGGGHHSQGAASGDAGSGDYPEEPSGGGSGSGAGGSGMKRKATPLHSPSIQLKQCRVLVHKYVVRPAPVPPPAKSVETAPGEKHMLDRELWMRIFKNLELEDLARAMAVCKTWYRWCLDQRLYRKLDLSRGKVQQAHLVGTVKRQPHILDLSWTNISHRQLSWLVARLPHLKQLYLEGNSWAACSALCCSSCPLLHVLNLKWVSGITDACARDLVSPPVDHRPGVDDTCSRLKQCRQLCLAGSDITDVSLRVITQNLPYLAKLDLSFCTRLTDVGISILAEEASAARLTLTDLDLTGCSRLTDACFDSLASLPNVKVVSLQVCPKITLDGCRRFIEQTAGARNLQMLSEKQFEPAD